MICDQLGHVIEYLVKHFVPWKFRKENLKKTQSIRGRSSNRGRTRVCRFSQHMLIIEMKVDNCIINNVYQNHFCICWPTRPHGGLAHCAPIPLRSRRARNPCQLTGGSVRNALVLRGALWVKQCKNGFNKRCLECNYLLSFQLSACVVKICTPYCRLGCPLKNQNGWSSDTL